MVRLIIEFEFEISDKVKIPELETTGFVISIWVTAKGIKYEVRYFANSEPKEVYFYSEELELVPNA